MMEYNSAVKQNELSSHEKTWRNFKCILFKKKTLATPACRESQARNRTHDIAVTQTSAVTPDP